MESLPRYVSALAVEKLIKIANEVTYLFSKNHYHRVGEHENNMISEYYFSKWYHWNRFQRKEFRSLIPKDLDDKIFLANFTMYRANTGFLDTIVQFRDRNHHLGRIVAIALYDNQKIIIERKEYTLNAGDAISFATREIHAVPKSSKDALWVVTCQT